LSHFQESRSGQGSKLDINNIVTQALVFPEIVDNINDINWFFNFEIELYAKPAVANAVFDGR
jgi:hypothetical protein